MLYNKIDINKYIDEFNRKFTNFADKAPILLSFYTDNLGVTIIHENSNTKYFYEWSLEIPVKSFIHNIKEELSYNHYPRIQREVEITRSPNEDEIANMITSGTPQEEIPETITEKKVETYRIDKILAMKDEFVLIDEDTQTQYCYKMQGSGIYFLKNYRTGKYKSPLEAGNEFFERSNLINKLTNIK